MAGGQTDAETEVKGEEQATDPDVIHCVYRFHKCIRSRVRNQILFFFNSFLDASRPVEK